MLDAKYSILWFCSEITSPVLESMKQYIREGIKVYFLTFDDTEELLNDTFLYDASEKNLLYLYMVHFLNDWDQKSIFFIDGNNLDQDLVHFLDKNSSFNLEQYNLEHASLDQHLIVTAGAGTGKTTTMINRLMYLKHMNANFNMSSAVMITFTNEAATHMRSKVLFRLKQYYDLTKNQRYLEWMENISKMFIGTIHSFAKEFLIHEGQKIGFSADLQVRSYLHEKRNLIEEFIDEYSVQYPDKYRSFKNYPHYFLVKSFMMMIEQINNKSIPYEAVLQMDYGVDPNQFSDFARFVVGNVLSKLVEIKKEDESLEISDLISVLSSIKDLVEMNLNIQYLFIDEFQDSDESQVKFISWLTETYQCQLFSIGDIKQSIYRFRGADYTAFIQLKENLAKGNQLYKEYSLRKNYRSEKHLIRQFNSLFHKWNHVVQNFTYGQIDQLIEVIEDSVEQGLVTLNLDDVNLNQLLNRLHQTDVAVLVRSNRQVQQTVERIESLGHFCEAVRTGSFYRSLPVREFYLLIRRLTHSLVAKDRYLFHQSSYGMNDLQINDWINQFSPDQSLMVDHLNELEKLQKWNVDLETKPVIFALQQLIDNIQPHEVYRIRYYQKHRIRFPNQDQEMQKKEAIIKAKEYKANLDRLIYFLKKEFGDFQATLYDFEKFLSIKMATDTSENEWRMEESVSHRIKVMTVHKAKGLEFDYVILPATKSAFIKNAQHDILLFQQSKQWKMGYHINWNDQIIENNHYQENIRDEKVETIAEEARLLYVALTRAKKGIYADSNGTLNERSIQCWSDLLESGDRQYV